jgi:hypothetical protein
MGKYYWKKMSDEEFRLKEPTFFKKVEGIHTE